MSKNIIFVFSGTGNSLWAARKMSKELENCEIVSMGSHTGYSLSDGYDTIGFIYPTYYRGIPAKVSEFVSSLDLNNNKSAYYFAVATCGKVSCSGNSVVQLHKLLKRKGIALNYADKVDMFSNYVIMYDMRDTVEEETRQSDIDLEPIIKMITNKATNKIDTVIEPFQQLAYKGMMHFVHNLDKQFNVSDACIKCGICKKVCPVKNIELGKDSKPYFNHHCEQCLACIQNCPTKAINYKDKTQSRKRYIHPNISWEDLAELNH
jgi:ferredoxin